MIDVSSTAREFTLFYTIYKTTNLLNGKFYVGKHQTKDLNDGYFGSGKLLVRAVKKHGAQNFITEIISIYEYEWQMNLAEKILVVTDDQISYNLCKGGHGGFGYIDQHRLRPKKRPPSKQWRARLQIRMREIAAKVWSPENKDKHRLNFVGSKNAQFGKPSWSKGKKFSEQHIENLKKAARLRESKKKLNK